MVFIVQGGHPLFATLSCSLGPLFERHSYIYVLLVNKTDQRNSYNLEL